MERAAERIDDVADSDRSEYVVGLMAVAAFCSIFWFAVGFGLGWYIAH